MRVSQRVSKSPKAQEPTRESKARGICLVAGADDRAPVAVRTADAG